MDLILKIDNDVFYETIKYLLKNLNQNVFYH